MAKSFYGIIGWPLTQTFSPEYFNKKFEELGLTASYLKLPLEHIDEFPALLKSHPGLLGLNVTIPHKTAVIPYLDVLTDAASAMGAVNCIDISAGKLTGHNTDWTGFMQSLQPLLQPIHTHALILGNGGAAKAIAYALRRLNISFRIVSRGSDSNALRYSDLTEDVLQQYKLIINTTPLGMVPFEDKAPPIPYHLLQPYHLLYDIIYTPEKSIFLKNGEAEGATIKNGLEMLHLQAEGSWDIWSPSLQKTVSNFER